MYPYIANTEEDKKEMLSTINLDKTEDLYKHIPEELLIDKLDLPESMSEMEVKSKLKYLANKNKTINDLTCFMGAGAYDHYIPSVVGHIIGKPEFYTAYTPYQPEISQGTLQAVFEYQSLICRLTGMDVSSISMYDVSTAMAEAAVMAVDSTRRKKIIVSQTVNPQSREILKTYTGFRGYEVVEIDDNEGVTDIEKLEKMIDKDTAAVIIQTPNFFGIIEEIEELEKIAHENKSLLIMSVDPLSLGILKTPADYGADIVVGDCQAFGHNLGFGGPYLGFLNTTKKLMRKMPGRIVGQTEDADGKRGFTLTLQTREQHIRREKATSNICSDQTLLTIGSAVYLSALGKKGIKEVGEQCIKKSQYAMKVITDSKKYKLLFKKPFFKEFVLASDVPTNKISEELFKKDILGGYDIGKTYPKYKNALMYCVTEKRTREEIDFLKETLEGITL